MQRTGELWRVAVASLMAAVSGCVGFHPLPLPTTAGAMHPGDVRVDPANMPVRDLARHHFDPRDGLDETETAMLAVANDPELSVLRSSRGIAHAQAFAAGLLPDPQIAWSQDFVTGGSGGPGATSPFGLGVSWDVGQLLTRSARTQAAQWNSREIDLNLLWAEWQVVAQARVLFTRIVSGRAAVARLQAEGSVLEPLRDRIDTALARGNLGADLALTGLSAAADVRQKLTAERKALNSSEHALRLLLGLKADVPLNLVGPPRTIAPTAATVRAALASLPERRPDLLALRAGYASQDEKLREAILKQFPAINVGFNRARDNAAVYTSGFAVSVTLPLFDRNRGNIAIEKATRENLRAAYAARLASSISDIDRLNVELRVEQAALVQLAAHTARLDGDLQRGERAWRGFQLDLATYLALRGNALAADLQLIQARQAAAETGIALEALVGDDWSPDARARMATDASPHMAAGTTPDWSRSP